MRTTCSIRWRIFGDVADVTVRLFLKSLLLDDEALDFSDFTASVPETQ